MILVGLLSGGLDSATAFAKALKELSPSHSLALTVIYGQTHKREVESAKAIASFYKVPHVTVDLSNVYNEIESSALLSGNIPDALSLEKGVVPSTYVPQRNLILISIASAFLEKLLIQHGETEGAISVGFHQTDYSLNEPVYPDTRPEFVKPLEKAINEGSSVVYNAHVRGRRARIMIYAPFINLRKSDVVREAVKLGVPLELTWTCYKGGSRPCGRCPACVTRLRAFMEAGVPDPLTESYEYLPSWYKEWYYKLKRR